jgi:secreted Zn-dependent insulinase-like peptidase
LSGFEYSLAEPGHIKFKLEQFLLKLVRALTYQDWKGIIKLHTLTRLFAVLHGKKLERSWLKFSEKLFNFTAKQEQVSAMTNLTNDELIATLEVLERLKVNRPPLVKSLLVGNHVSISVLS